MIYSNERGSVIDQKEEIDSYFNQVLEENLFHKNNIEITKELYDKYYKLLKEKVLHGTLVKELQSVFLRTNEYTYNNVYLYE